MRLTKKSTRRRSWVLPLGYLVLTTLWLRLVNLGYSDYQGDEIKALARLSPGQSLTDFLLQQRKGPFQFLVTYLTGLILPGYANAFLVRLPFALAGILAIFFFYRLVNLHFGRKIALYASLLLSSNGLFVAFSRIVQYQSLVILFSVLSLYALSLAVKYERWRLSGLYLGLFFWAVAILSHSDGIFILPFVLYLYYRWHKENADIPLTMKAAHVALSGTMGAVLIAGFYVPLLLSATELTQNYWFGRLLGSVQPKQSSSIVTFRLYNPPLVIYGYYALGFLSLLKIRKMLIIVLWFLFPWVVMELIIRVPGTHIYTYLLPTIILLAFGIQVIEERVTGFLGSRFGNILNTIGLAAVFLFVFSLSHTIYVDHNREYPWETERFLFWNLGKPDISYHLSIFGFPYYRNWEGIGDYLGSEKGSGYYATNEKVEIASYYVPLELKQARAGYFIVIRHPQTFNDRFFHKKIDYWMERYEPVMVFSRQGRVLAEIYDMPQGTLKELREAGY